MSCFGAEEIRFALISAAEVPMAQNWFFWAHLWLKELDQFQSSYYILNTSCTLNIVLYIYYIHIIIYIIYIYIWFIYFNHGCVALSPRRTLVVPQAELHKPKMLASCAAGVAG